MAYVGKIYVNTLASYNEKFLLDIDKVRRIMDASYDEALRILFDCGKGDGESTADGLLKTETDKLLGFVRENAPDDKVSFVLLAPFAYNDVKATYKERISGTKVPDAFFGGFEEYTSGVENADYNGLPDALADALEQLDEKAETSSLTPREIDYKITLARYADCLNVARGNKTLTAYQKSEIDLVNLLSLFRARVTGDRNAFGEAFVPGGSLDIDELTKALDGSDEAFNLAFLRSEYAEVFDGIERGSEAITDLETHIDDYLYALTLKGKDDFTSNNPFINYFYRAYLEIKVMRAVLVCLKNGAGEEIKRRLRAIYD